MFFFYKFPGFWIPSQLRIHKMMTDCMHYKDYARDAIKLVVQKLEGGVVDGKRGGEGPSVEMWPGAPSNLKTALNCLWGRQLETTWLTSSPGGVKANEPVFEWRTIIIIVRGWDGTNNNFIAHFHNNFNTRPVSRDRVSP